MTTGKRDPKGFSTKCSVAMLLVAIVMAMGEQPAFGYPRPGETIRVSVSSQSEQSESGCIFVSFNSSQPAREDGDSYYPTISGNGRYVAFQSCAGNLDPQDTNKVMDIYRHDLRSGETELVSTNALGLASVGVCAEARPGAVSAGASISRDGRYVAFDSCAPDLVPGDTNPGRDVFVKDMLTGQIEMVSVRSDGSPPLIAQSTNAQINADGRFVAFGGSGFASPSSSSGVNLESPPAVFRHDRATGLTVPVDVSQDGHGGLGGCPSISPEGRFVTFQSGASDLVTGDTNGSPDVFLRDMDTSMIERVSVASDGREGIGVGLGLFGWGDCFPGGSRISRDGRFVAFTSLLWGLVPGDSNDQEDVFVRDRQRGRTERVSVLSTGEQALYGSQASISPDGRYVGLQGASDMYGRQGCSAFINSNGCKGNAFVYDRELGLQTWASLSSRSDEPGQGGSSAAVFDDHGSIVTFYSGGQDFVPEDTNGHLDVFVRRIGAALGVGSLNDEPAHEIEGVSRFARNGYAKTWVGETSGLGAILGLSVASRPSLADLFFRVDVDRVLLGTPLNVYGVSFRTDSGRYEIRASGALATRSLDHADLGQIALYRCAPSRCVLASSLEGSFGVTGEQIAASVPLEAVGLSRGGVLRDVRAFSGVGSLTSGVQLLLDELALSRYGPR